jgi:hypothetical protein
MRRTTMILTSAGVLSAMTVLAVVVSACGGSDPPPATSPSATAYPQQGGYPQQQPYPQQQQYPQQQYPQQQPQTQQQPAAAGSMAVPGPLAFACQNDSACGLHRCNLQYQKCAFPCAGPVDCAQGNQCTMGVCTPKPPGSP